MIHHFKTKFDIPENPVDFRNVKLSFINKNRECTAPSLHHIIEIRPLVSCVPVLSSVQLILWYWILLSLPLMRNELRLKLMVVRWRLPRSLFSRYMDTV